MLVVGGAVKAQETESLEDVNVENEFLNKNRLGVCVGYAWIPSGSDINNQSTMHIVPSFGVKYTRRFSEKIGLAWTNEVEFANYMIEYEGHGELEREFAFVSAVLFSYEPIPKLGLFAGPGVELERNQNFFVLKVGVEYEVKLLDDRFISTEAYYDIKEVYGALGLGLSVGAKF